MIQKYMRHPYLVSMDMLVILHTMDGEFCCSLLSLLHGALHGHLTCTYCLDYILKWRIIEFTYILLILFHLIKLLVFLHMLCIHTYAVIESATNDRFLIFM